MNNCDELVQTILNQFSSLVPFGNKMLMFSYITYSGERENYMEYIVFASPLSTIRRWILLYPEFKYELPRNDHETTDESHYFYVMGRDCNYDLVDNSGTSDLHIITFPDDHQWIHRHTRMYRYEAPIVEWIMNIESFDKFIYDVDVVTEFISSLSIPINQVITPLDYD